MNIAGVFSSSQTFGTSGVITGVATTLADYSAQMLGLQAAQTNDARVTRIHNTVHKHWNFVLHPFLA